MPRRTATAPTTDTLVADLEQQTTADYERETLPEFPEAQTADDLLAIETPSTNGHSSATYVADPDGFNVRPSEQCHAPSPLGISCSRREFHSGGHSWSPQEPLDQAELPGTPEPEPAGVREPEPTDFDIPFEAQFNGADFQAAPGIKAIAERLIAETEEFSHLVGINIRYFWKRRGGLKGGNPRLGNLQRPAGLAAYALGRPTFALWLGADHVRDAKLTDEQMTALVFQQLCRGAVDPDDHSSYRIVGADFEGFALEVERFGLWNKDLREAAASLRQLPLDQELPLDDDGDADEAGEDE